MVAKLPKEILTPEEYILHPHNPSGEHNLKLSEILHEIQETLLFRSDGIRINITRTTLYPKHRGKNLIHRVEIEIWDCAA